MIQDYQEKVEELKKQVDQQQNYIDNLEYLNQELKNDLNENDTKKTHFETKIKTLKKKMSEKEEVVEKLTKQKTELEEINKVIRQEFDEYGEKERMLSLKEEEMQQLLEENQEIQSKLRQLETKELNRDLVLDKDIENLISKKNQKIEIYEKELAKMMKENKGKENKYQDLLHEKKELAINYEELSKQFRKQSKALVQYKTVIQNNKIKMP